MLHVTGPGVRTDRAHCVQAPDSGGHCDWREPVDLHRHRYMTEDVALGLAGYDRERLQALLHRGLA